PLVLAAALPLAVASCATPDGLRVLANDGEFVRYAGSIRLSGVYFTDTANAEIGESVCFVPDASSQARLPDDGVGHSPHWLCFSNDEDARTLLGLAPPAPGKPTGCDAGSA